MRFIRSLWYRFYTRFYIEFKYRKQLRKLRGKDPFNYK